MFNCSQVLLGHGDIVLSLDVDSSGTRLVTTSKDRTVRLWNLAPMLEGGEAQCVGVGVGHTGAVGSCAMARRSSFALSGSEDRTLKRWHIPTSLLSSRNAPAAPVQLKANLTCKAHDKDINSIAVSPNDKLIATGSQDKTVKVRAPDHPTCSACSRELGHLLTHLSWYIVACRRSGTQRRSSSWRPWLDTDEASGASPSRKSTRSWHRRRPTRPSRSGRS